MMKKNKIGIITHYYKSHNYGGNLQAFALCKYLNNLGFSAEQICYQNKAPASLRRSLAFAYHAFFNSVEKIKHHSVLENIKLRNRKIEGFNRDEIPHSKRVFSGLDFRDMTDYYDFFITGSDQVWHPLAVCDAYLLNFNKKGINKISYAASVSKDSLTEAEKEYYKKALADYKAISVREQEAVGLISSISQCDVSWAVDPVFLLDRDEWDLYASKRIVNEKYLFCYFLGDDANQRKVAKEYAKSNGLKIVTLPHLKGKFVKEDDGFGDVPLYEISPFDMVSLIKYSDCVMTDSFHALAFSLIFDKKFFVFDRKAAASMASRIRSVLDLFDMSICFCNTDQKISLDYIKEIESISKEKNLNAFLKLQENSKNYLERSLTK